MGHYSQIVGSFHTRRETDASSGDMGERGGMISLHRHPQIMHTLYDAIKNTARWFGFICRAKRKHAPSRSSSEYAKRIPSRYLYLYRGEAFSARLPGNSIASTKGRRGWISLMPCACIPFIRYYIIFCFIRFAHVHNRSKHHFRGLRSVFEHFCTLTCNFNAPHKTGFTRG